MHKSPIVSYILKARERDHSDKEIRKNLTAAGWPEDSIRDGMTEALTIQTELDAQALPVPSPTGNLRSLLDTELNAKNFSASKVLLYLGALIVILAGLTYVSINWTQWTPASRIAAIFVPMALSYILGIIVWKKPQLQIQSRAFVLIGGLLFPLFIAVTFRQLHLFASPESDNFFFTLCGATVVVYLLSSIITKMAIWAPLLQLATLSLFIYFLRLLGFTDTENDPVLYWLLFAFGAVSFFSAILHERQSQHLHGRYTAGTSFFVMALSLAMIFILGKSITAMLLLLFVGVMSIFVGGMLDRGRYKDYSLIPYLIGFCLLVGTLCMLPDAIVRRQSHPVPGKTMKTDRAGYTYRSYLTDDEYREVYKLQIGSGVLFALIAYFMKSKQATFPKFAVFVQLLRFISPIVVLGLILLLGLGAHHVVEEVLLLVVSLIFIFASIPGKVQQYLLIGTIFLIISIFSTGGEYFQNEVGWPITLFVAGLLSMGISIGMEKIRRSYGTRR